MKHVLCVLLNNWPIDRLRRRLRRGERRHDERPLVLIRTVANRREVVGVCDGAYRAGIRIGMTLAQARALCAHVIHAEHEPHRDALALEALARWMMRFSPVVSLPRPEGLFLDLTGCERALGGLNNIIMKVAAAMKRLGISVRLAVAATPGAAWAIAFASGQDATIIDEVDLSAALKPLPPIALRIAPYAAARLRHLGIDTIGRLMQLPRDALPARFGHELLARLDQALGRIPEPLVPVEPLSPIQARMDFDGVVDSPEAIWIAFKKLIAQVVAELLRRGRGAQQLEIQFFRPYTTPIVKSIRLSRPSRNPVNLFNLLRCAMENLKHNGQECPSPDGFVGIRLIVCASQRISDQQIHLLEHEQFIVERELSRLIERLRIRLGEDALSQAEMIESHVPERAYSLRATTRGSGVFSVVRPLHLLHMPEEVGVIVCPSDDREGRPVSFTRCGQVHRLTHAVGPERIAGQWWRGHHRTRDYFDAEDETGRRFWLFRVMESFKWYLHGQFE